MKEKGLPWHLGVNALVPRTNWCRFSLRQNVKDRQWSEEANRPDSRARNPLTKFVDWLFPGFSLRERVWHHYLRAKGCQASLKAGQALLRCSSPVRSIIPRCCPGLKI